MGPRGPSGLFGANVLEYGALADATTDDSAAINAALASGQAQVFFPPGTYKVGSAVTGSASGQAVTFAPGATLLVAPGRTVVFNGIRMRIQGTLAVTLATASSSTWVAVRLSGTGSRIAEALFNVDADVPNCTLLQMAGDNSTSGPMTIAGVGSFRRGLDLAHADDTRVTRVHAGRVWCFLVDDEVHTRNYESIIRYRCTRSETDGVAIVHGGRQLIDAIVDVDGQHNILRNPQIDSSAGANYGILMRDEAEFLEVFGGEIVGNYLAGSKGIQCGLGSATFPASGQLKAYGLKIRNWDIGVRFTGTCDSPAFYGGSIQNNKTAQVQIDSKRGSDVWPISGLAFHGVYSEEVAFPGAPFLHCKTGTLLGLSIAGGEIGYTGTALLVESTFAIADGEIGGARLPAAGPTDAVSTPNEFTRFHFSRNSQSGSNLVGKGTYAANAISVDDPTLDGVTVGSGGSRLVFQKTFTATANFGSALTANTTFELSPISCPGALLLDEVTVSLSGALAAKDGVLPFAYVSSNGNISLRCTNTSGTNHTGASGSARFTVRRFSP